MKKLLRLVQAVAYNSCSEAEKTLLTELSILNEDFSGRQAAYITENGCGACSAGKSGAQTWFYQL